MSRRLVGVAAALFAAACGEEQMPVVTAEAATAMTAYGPATDSVVDAASATPPAPPTWRLSEPALQIGEADGDERYVLHRADAAVLLLDGRVVVMNAGTHALVWYGRDGHFIRWVGRRGAGPGEFRSPTWAELLSGDSVAVWDLGNRRLSVFDTAGVLAREMQVDVGGMFPEIAGVLEDGSLVMIPGPDVFALSVGERGVRRLPLNPVRVHPGAPATALGTWPGPGPEVYVHDREGGFGWQQRPFGATSPVAVARDAIYVGDGATGEISVLAPDGEVLRRLRSPHERWPVDKATRETYRARTLTRMAGDRREEVARVLTEIPFPDRAAAIGDLHVAPDGNVWVAASARPGEGVTWAVLTPTGEVVARVVTPADLDVYRVGRDHVLGRRRDEFGVERIELYTIPMER